MMTPDEPNKENIRLWVDALRSGKYKQLKGNLTDGRSHCCLGVACEVAIQNDVPLQRRRSFYISYFDDDSVKYNSILPPAVAAWLGVECLPLVRSISVASLNDGRWQFEDLNPEHDDHSYSFDQIADLIEEEYLNA